MKFKTVQRGFTLLELMVTVAIIAILAMLAYPSYETFMQRSRMDNARATVSDVIQFMERHYANSNTFCAARTGTCTAPDISAITTNANDRYDIRIDSVSSSNFVLVGIPDKAGDASSSKPLNLFFDSTNSTLTKCTSSGLAKAKAKTDPGSECELL